MKKCVQQLVDTFRIILICIVPGIGDDVKLGVSLFPGPEWHVALHCPGSIRVAVHQCAQCLR